ncbi:MULTISPECIES: aminodeoxychorismate synthase component I [unclassified Sphingomonas]|jgi:para-aminobenzoate synthetase/4-amino-4-deoxychorismate lyase|uniref:aminodeoxychorismate synthase component I n=1 Tax=unclassified Sphingomonas TaxID=196159 RepID=UPI00082A61F4|nr:MULTISPECIES: aminodeoxychorismate synthase component I [unclassified Sphingomonas]
MMYGTSPPFVLVDDARTPGTPARLYRDPVRILRADRLDAVAPLLDAIDAAVAQGAHVAGFLGYEAGFALEPRLTRHARMLVPDGDDRLPVGWFGVFDAVTPIDADALHAALPPGDGAYVGAAVPEIDPAGYAARFATVHDAILAGDIYQANLTFAARAPVAGHPLALYAAIRARAAAGYGGVVWTGEDWLLSFSPELFFAAADRRIAVRPMKGTAARGDTPEQDRQAAAALRNDPKQRAENLMIVDLMRNDLSRIARPGSVTVPEAFAIETYPSVHQMVSTVAAELPDRCPPSTMLRALFPCGSITGAPKLRAMEILAEVEGEPRGAYTGAIGTVTPQGSAQFNVAIRTLHLKPGALQARIGLGSGVVADSVAEQEWAECLTKAAFLTTGARPIDLVETIAFDPLEGMPLLERHLERMRASAAALGFRFDRHGARNELQAATFRLRAAARVRLLLARGGTIAIEVAPMPATPALPVPVDIRPLPVDADDFRLAHKTSDRRHWAAARAGATTFDTLFTHAAGLLTEGSFTSIFVERPDGMLMTPLLRPGMLPGVLRAHLIAEGRAVEADLTPADCAQGLFVGNALRGLIAARLVADDEGRG